MAHINPIHVQEFLKGIDYPATKQELQTCAQEHGAPDEVMQALRQVPDKEYDNPTELSEEIGNLV